VSLAPKPTELDLPSPRHRRYVGRLDGLFHECACIGGHFDWRTWLIASTPSIIEHAAAATQAE